MAKRQAAHTRKALLWKTLVGLMLLSAIALLLSAAMPFFWPADEVGLISESEHRADRSCSCIICFAYHVHLEPANTAVCNADIA